jgi:iron complex transport system substrate-binding protein
MKKNPIMKIWVHITTVLIFCAAVYPSPVPASAALEGKGASRIEVEDFRGKKLVFSKPVSRIVCLLDSALTGLYMLGAEDRIVGVSMSAYNGNSARYYAAMDPRLKENTLPVVSSSSAGSLERVIALVPDLVIIWSLNKETITALEERNIPVFGVFIDGVEDIYKEVLALGKITGTDGRAHELFDFTRKEIGRVSEKTAAISKDQWPKAYFMWAKGELDSAGSTSIVQELLDISGARNICGHIQQEHVVIGMEHLLIADPPIIFMWYNPLLDPADFLQKPGWRSLAAARNKRIYEMPDLFACDLCTLNFQFSVKLLARWCHPELFNGLDMKMEAERIFSMLYSAKLPKALLADTLHEAKMLP